METGLVQALGNFLQIQSLFICLDNSKEDADYEADKDFVLYENARPFVVQDQMELERLVRQEDRGAMAMIYCPSFLVHDGLDRRSFGKNVAWLVPESLLEGDGGKLPPLRLDSFLIGYSPTNGADGSSYQLTEHYALKGQALENVLGHYTREDGLRVTKKEKWRRRTDFRQIPLVGAFFSYYPIAFKDGEGNMRGVLHDIVHNVQMATNFRYQVSTY